MSSTENRLRAERTARKPSTAKPKTAVEIVLGSGTAVAPPPTGGVQCSLIRLMSKILIVPSPLKSIPEICARNGGLLRKVEIEDNLKPHGKSTIPETVRECRRSLAVGP